MAMASFLDSSSVGKVDGPTAGKGGLNAGEVPIQARLCASRLVVVSRRMVDFLQFRLYPRSKNGKLADGE